MTPSVPHSAPPPDAPVGLGGSHQASGLRIAACALGSVGSGLLALLFVACALLPLIHVAGDAPRRFQAMPVLAQSTGVPASDAGVRIVSTLIDLDDACEDAVQPPLTAIPCLRAPRPASPRSAPGLGTTTRTPLERPPRHSAVG